MWTPQRIAAYRIVRTEGFGNRTISRIFERSPNPEDFLLDPTAWNAVPLTEEQIRRLRDSISSPIDSEIRTMEEQGITFALPGDDAYPARLRTIPGAPEAVFVRGAPIEDRLAIAIVGTRKMTTYGERSAAFFASELANIGAVIVSGLALGLDGVAHRACLDAGGRTIAVLPGGADDRMIVPQSHAPLAKRILANAGTICSERAPGADAHPYDYLHRNRIIAGLADAVLVIEGDRDSGALVTARHALEQGKDVLAVPGPIWSNASRGTNALIRDGATLCSTVDDVLSALRLGNSERAKEAVRTREELPASSEESEILALMDAPISLDDLVRRAKKPAGAVSGVVSLLEMKGRIIAVGPRMYARTS